MRQVGLKVLKNKLSEYVRLAASGETVVITDRDRPVAELVPLHRESNLTPFEERGIREGWLRLPTDRSGVPPPRHPTVPFDELMRELDQDREDR